jgi:hypothetical protein
VTDEPIKVRSAAISPTLLLRPVKYRTYSTEIPCITVQPPPASTHIKPIHYTLKLFKMQYPVQKKLHILFEKFSPIFKRFFVHIAQWLFFSVDKKPNWR